MKTEWYDRMIKALQLNGKGERTQEAYARALRMLVEFYDKSPDLITEEELQDYFLHRKNTDHWSPPALLTTRAAHRVHESPLLRIHEPQRPCSPRSRQYPDRNVLRLQSALTPNRHRTLAALSLSNLWRYPQTPFLTAASQNSCVFGIGGIPYQKTKICSSCFPPALSRSGGLAEVRPLTKSFNSTPSA